MVSSSDVGAAEQRDRAPAARSRAAWPAELPPPTTKTSSPLTARASVIAAP